MSNRLTSNAYATAQPSLWISEPDMREDCISFGRRIDNAPAAGFPRAVSTSCAPIPASTETPIQERSVEAPAPELSALESFISFQQEIILRQEAIITIQEQRIAQCDQSMSKQQQMIAERDRYIAQQQQALQSHQSALNRMNETSKMLKQTVDFQRIKFHQVLQELNTKREAYVRAIVALNKPSSARPALKSVPKTPTQATSMPPAIKPPTHERPASSQPSGKRRRIAGPQ